MEKFHSEYTFQIQKERVEFNKTFSSEACDVMFLAIRQFILGEIGSHWACKGISIKVAINGEYNPEEKNTQN